MTTKPKKRPAWIAALMNRIERINAAYTPYHIGVDDTRIVVRWNTSETGFATDAEEGDYVLRQVERIVAGFDRKGGAK